MPAYRKLWDSKYQKEPSGIYGEKFDLHVVSDFLTQSLHNWMLGSKKLKDPKLEGIVSGEIDHSSSAVMIGERTAKNYLSMQKIVGKVYLNKFFQVLAAHKRPGRFLEIGSGPGYQTAEVMQKFHPEEIVVVEPSIDMVSAAKVYMDHRGYADKVAFKIGFVEDEKIFKSLGKFNLIYSTLSLHHWADPADAFHNLYQALESDGLIIIHDFQRIEMPFHLNFHKGNEKSEHAIYSADEISHFLDIAGISKFEVISSFPFQIILIPHSDSEKTMPEHLTADTLAKLKPGQEGAIAAIRTDEERKRKLEAAGVCRTAHIRVIDSDLYNVIFGMERKTMVIDKETASGIVVQVFFKNNGDRSDSLMA
jgi:SAM-dependent methyltransferase